MHNVNKYLKIDIWNDVKHLFWCKWSFTNFLKLTMFPNLFKMVAYLFYNCLSFNSTLKWRFVYDIVYSDFTLQLTCKSVLCCFFFTTVNYLTGFWISYLRINCQFNLWYYTYKIVYSFVLVSITIRFVCI